VNPQKIRTTNTGKKEKERRRMKSRRGAPFKLFSKQVRRGNSPAITKNRGNRMKQRAMYSMAFVISAFAMFVHRHAFAGIGWLMTKSSRHSRRLTFIRCISRTIQLRLSQRWRCYVNRTVSKNPTRLWRQDTVASLAPGLPAWNNKLATNAEAAAEKRG